MLRRFTAENYQNRLTKFKIMFAGKVRNEELALHLEAKKCTTFAKQFNLGLGLA